MFVSRGSSVKESPKNTIESLLQNPVNPNFNPALVLQYIQPQIPRLPYEDKHFVRMYFSDSTISAAAQDKLATIHVSILFAVGSELNRHGIRTFFEKADESKAVIVVPGTDPPRDPSRWGIGISDDQIKALIHEQFKKDVSYEVNVLAGFSTGACGLHQTLLHNLLDLGSLQRVIYFDCLYKMQCTSTPASAALANVKSRARSAKVLVYQTSEGGNDFTDSTNTILSVPNSTPLLFDTRGIIKNLYQQNNYISVVCFRMLEPQWQMAL